MTCGAKHPKNREVCTRDANHVGVHSNGGNVTWKEPKPKAAEPQVASAPAVCGNAVRAASTGKPVKGPGAKACEREPGHEGPHRIGPHGEFGHVTEWNDHTPGCVSYNQKFHPNGSATPGSREPDDEDDDPLDDEVRSDADRDLARKHREEREAHAAELEEAPEEEAAPTGTVFRNVMVGMRRRDIAVHPAADALPLIDGAEFEALVEDIRANGVRTKPVLTPAGDMLVDGRNRMRACERLGIEPQFEFLSEGESIAAYVISTNLKRRHLTESQRAAIASEIANLGQGHRKTRPGAGVDGKITQAEAAAGAGVGERTVQRANAVHDKAVPELWTAVKSGKVDLKGAEQVAKLSPAQQRKLVKERIEPSKGPVRGGKIASLARQEGKRETVRKINTGRVAPMPIGQFGVIYADYPWKYDNSDQHEGSRGHMTYPPMELEAIIAHAREAGTRAGKDCIVALWVTNLYIPHIGRVVEAYGAKHHTMLTWPKQKAGVGTWPRGQTEHLVIASIGEPVHTLNEITTLLPSYAQREHSRKPDEVADLLRKHCAGPFIELFGRDAREGWTVWGAEAEKFATEAA